MSDVLRIEKDGEVIWEGEINGNGMVLDTKMMIKPIYNNKVDWFSISTNDAIKDTTFKTESFKHMTLKFQSIAAPKHEGQFPNAITQAAYEKAMADYEMTQVPPPTDEEVAEALEKAADLFLTEGWAQGGYHVSKHAAAAQKYTTEQLDKELGIVPTTTWIDETHKYIDDTYVDDEEEEEY